MALEDLTQAIVPPESPPTRGAMTWSQIEAQTRTALPRDYKAYIETFGLGYLDHFICVFSPFTDNKYLNLSSQVEIRLAALRELRAQHHHEVPYALFPNQGGLLPFGATDNGDVFFWLTEGQPDEWKVVLNAARDPRCEEYPGGMTRVLAQLLSKAVRSQILPPDFPSDNPSFNPLD